MWEKTRTEAETEAVDAIQTRCPAGLGSVAVKVEQCGQFCIYFDAS